MKTNIFIFLLLLAFIHLNFFGFSQEKLSKEEYQKIMDEKFGFRGIKLESTIQSFGNNLKFIKSSENGMIKVYRRINESKIVGKAKLQFIEYIFFNKKLLYIFIRLEAGKNNSDSFADMIEEVYGHYHTLSPSLKGLQWLSNKMAIQWDNDPDGDDITFATRGKVREEYDLYKNSKEKNQFKQGVKDF